MADPQLSCCLTSTEARWPVRDGDRVGSIIIMSGLYKSDQ